MMIYIFVKIKYIQRHNFKALHGMQKKKILIFNHNQSRLQNKYSQILNNKTLRHFNNLLFFFYTN